MIVLLILLIRLSINSQDFFFLLTSIYMIVHKPTTYLLMGAVGFILSVRKCYLNLPVILKTPSYSKEKMR